MIAKIFLKNLLILILAISLLSSLALAHQESFEDKIKKAKSDYYIVSDQPLGQVVAGKSVDFLKVIETKKNQDISVPLPLDSSNIKVLASKKSGKEKVELTFTATTTENALYLNLDNLKGNKLLEIYYTTSGPSLKEALELIRDRKKVTVSSDFHYVNVLASTKLYNPLPVGLIRLVNLQSDGTELPVDVNYIDANNDGLVEGIQWIVPHLSTESFVVGLNSGFNTQRVTDSDLPSGWYVQASGYIDEDDECVNETSWTVSTDTLLGTGNSMLFDPTKDTKQLGCGLKLPSFTTSKGNIAMTFNVKSNFTQSQSSLEMLDYGGPSANCGFKFTGEKVTEQAGCTVSMASAEKGWNAITVDWEVLSDTEPISFFITPPFILAEMGETGTITVDNMVIILPQEIIAL